MENNTAEVVGGGIVTPQGTIALSAEQAQEVADAVEEAEKQRMQMVRDLVGMLTEKREAVVKARRDIERRWIDDARQIEGDSRLQNTKEYPSQTTNDHLKPPKPHLTRARTDLWESRMIDLIAPTTDPTWDLRPLAEEYGDDPMTRQDAEQRSQAMKRVIQDQLAACNAQKALRRMCRDACRMGTGLIMGPLNGTRTRRTYSPTPQQPQGIPQQQPQAAQVSVKVTETVIPEIREADPWCFFPDMVDNAERAEFAFYVHWMSQTELYSFMDFPGVDRDEVSSLMDEEPDYGEILQSIRERRDRAGENEDVADRWPVWRYTGIVDRKYLEALNIELPDEDRIVSADIWFSGEHILKAKVTQLSAVRDFRIPYFVFSPFALDGTMFGASVPYLCRDSARMADSSLLIALANASVSAGPQIFMRKGKFTPADGKYDVRGPKTWHVLDDTVPIDDMLHVVQITNNATEAMEIFNVAKQLMDEELNTSQWASPDTSEETQTASGLAMLMNARTILQRRVCATADDDVFRPLIERFVLWNLLYNPREEIKGDYDVLPLCQSVRLVKDIQLQQKLFVASTLAQNPQFAGMFSTYDMLKDIIGGLDVQVDNWLVPKEQWQQMQQQQQQSPQSQQAALQTQLLQAKIQTEQAKHAKMFNDTQLAAQQQANQSGNDATFVSADRQLDHQEFMVEKQLQMHDMNSRLAQNQNDNNTKQMLAAMKQQSDREKNNTVMAAAMHKARTDLINTGVNARIQVHKAELGAAPKAPASPKVPSGSFKAPKLPTYRGGKR